MNQYTILEHPDCKIKTHNLELSDGMKVTYITKEFGPKKIHNSHKTLIKKFIEQGWIEKKA